VSGVAWSRQGLSCVFEADGFSTTVVAKYSVDVVRDKEKELEQNLVFRRRGCQPPDFRGKTKCTEYKKILGLKGG